MANTQMTSRTGHGFTLVELMVVIACALLILVPVIRVMRSGTQASLQGMQQIDTVLAGQRILQQIRADFRSACLDTRKFPARNSANEEIPWVLGDLLKSKQSGQDDIWTFLGFPQHDPIAEAIPGYLESSGVNTDARSNPRTVAQITYRYTRNQAGKPAGKLVRIETFNGRERQAVLSENVAFFSLKLAGEGETPVENRYVRISLQLYRSKNLTPHSTREAPLEFYDVAVCDFFRGYQEQPSRRLNWYSRLKGPTETPLWLPGGF